MDYKSLTDEQLVEARTAILAEQGLRLGRDIEGVGEHE